MDPFLKGKTKMAFQEKHFFVRLRRLDQLNLQFKQFNKFYFDSKSLNFRFFAVVLLPQTRKSTISFFAFRALQFWEINFFDYYLGKFGFNIFPDLKSKQIKKKFAYFFVILTKTHFLKHEFLKNYTIN